MSVCIPKDKVASVLKLLGIEITDGCPSQSTPQSPSQSAAKESIVLSSQQTKDITQAIQGVLSVERPLSTATVLSHVMTFYTKNVAPATMDFSEEEYQFDWMGISRLYLSPLNLGNLLDGLKAGQYTVDWIKVKVLGITLVPSERSGASVLRKDVEDEDQSQTTTQMENAVDNVFSLDGTMYTVGYLPASKFFGNTTTIKEVGDSFIKKYHSEGADNTINYFTGEGFTAQRITGIDTQYDGKYAAMYPESQTQALASATEIVIRNPVGYPLSLTSSTAISNSNKAPINTYSLSGTTSVFTKEETQAFRTSQGTAGAVSGATTPFFGMIQIDLPEDLIQDVYQKIDVDARLDQVAQPNETSGDLEYTSSVQEITRWTNKVLNANFNVLIEYGVSQ